MLRSQSVVAEIEAVARQTRSQIGRARLLTSDRPTRAVELTVAVIAITLTSTIFPGFLPPTTSPLLPSGDHTAAAFPASTPAWANLTSSTGGPSARDRVAMTYDPIDGYVLLFGGYNAAKGWTFYNDTWTFQNGSWTRIFPASAPSPRASSAMVYDPSLRAVVLFGGNAYGSQFDDTWTFAHGKWAQLRGSIFPSPRFNAGIAYDTADREVVLFGGDYAPSLNVDVGLGDTWVLNGTTWMKLSLLTSPSPRAYPAMAYSSVDGAVILFGGWATTNNTYLDDTWSFQNSSWSSVALQSPPRARSSSALADYPSRGVLMFGGSSVSSARFNDTWLYESGDWDPINSSTSPGARCCMGLAFDQRDGYVVLFGGRLSNYGAWVGDSWILWLGNTSGSGGSGDHITSTPLSVHLEASPLAAGALSFELSATVSGGQPPYSVTVTDGQGGVMTYAEAVNDSPLDWATTYSAPGVYLAGATVRDATGGRVDTQVVVRAGVASLMEAKVSEVPGSGSSIGAVKFMAIIQGWNPPFSLHWTFGDGAVGTSHSGIAITHVYNATGTYSPRLEVSDSLGHLGTYQLRAVSIELPSRTNDVHWHPSYLPTLGAFQWAIAILGALVLIAVLGLFARRSQERNALTRVLGPDYEGDESALVPTNSFASNREPDEG